MARLLEEFRDNPRLSTQGPFILASILRCPVQLIFALRQQANPYIHCEPSPPADAASRRTRQALQHAIDRYAQRL